MGPAWRAVLDFGHLLGVGLLAGAVLAVPGPTGGDEQPGESPAKGLALAGIALVLATGFVKWAPFAGGIGWLGGGGLRTAFLHGKLLLALVVCHLAWSSVRAAEADRRRRRARVAASLGALVMLLGCLHHWGV